MQQKQTLKVGFLFGAGTGQTPKNSYGDFQRLYSAWLLDFVL
jgi:hypothetical protein